MTANSGAPATAPSPGRSASRGIWSRPSTRLGGLAAAQASLFAALLFLNPVLMLVNADAPWRETVRPFLNFISFFWPLCGLSSGIMALVALIRSRERSWLVWLSLLPPLLAVLFLLGEFMFLPFD